MVFQCFPCEARYSEHKAYVTALLKRLGLTWRDVQPPSAQPEIVEVYDYHREDGGYLFSVFRYEPKSFRQGVRVEGTQHVDWGLGSISSTVPAARVAGCAG